MKIKLIPADKMPELKPLTESDKEVVMKRFATRIEDVLPLDDYSLLVFFRNGIIKKCELKRNWQ